MNYREWIARGLAHALLADAQQPGALSAAALRARGAAALGQDPPWLGALAQELARTPLPTWQSLELHTLTRRIAEMPEMDAAFEAESLPRIQRLILRPARMRPAPLGLHDLDLPALPTADALAQWLGLSLDELDWLAGPQQVFRDNAAWQGREPARHYRQLLRPKRRGGLRLLEAPLPVLAVAQRRILSGLLARVPAHEAAHGFVAGRSALSHAGVHGGQAVVLGFDLRDFFPSVHAGRVHALWHTLGYPRGVARLLTRLCTTRTPSAVLQRMREEGAMDWLAAKRFASAHLPQGAPTSPALANLAAFALDLRLEGLAHAFGARYSRYADDLCFSGPEALRREARTLAAWVDAIVRAEGFALHPRKTRVAPQHRQQRVTGLVVNVQPQVPRADFDRLKAILHRCAVHGPAGENQEALPDFRAHLLGRIAWVGQSSATRQARLMRLFARIVWTAPEGPSQAG